ncbi:MAG: ABC transporter permease [Anaerolineaceae bacterium]|jgi:peptide/nickel transport system permease protein|nr:ABC transporter permease [Anaerolineae bacterium]MDX9829859.1 ABC transporter permease [Anaerolineae bacterium]NLF11519.1 ABC transporter permease [Anaerolineaceae bacterium]
MASSVEAHGGAPTPEARRDARTRRWQRFWDGASVILGSRVAVIGLSMVLFWVAVAIVAPVISPHNPTAQDSSYINGGPSAEYPLGTDHMGRDILSRLAYGSRTILILAPLSVLASVIVGTFLGLVGGYFGGIVDEVVMRILDAIMAFPTILLYLIIISALGPSPLNVVIAITFVGAPGVARLVRSLTLDIRSRDYVRAAETRGENPLYIMFVEILPNARGPLIIDAMLRVGYAIFSIGTLGFLGLGLPPPTPDWGGMISEARKYIWTSPLNVLWPALAISSLVVGLNLFADGLREESTRYQ